MVGIYNGMLFWKKDVTYQFLEPVKNLEKAYKDKIFDITHNRCIEELEYEVLDEPIPVKSFIAQIQGNVMQKPNIAIQSVTVADSLDFGLRRIDLWNTAIDSIN